MAVVVVRVTLIIGSGRHHLGVEGRRFHHFLFSRHDSNPDLSNFRDGLHGDQEVLLSHPQKTSGAYLQEAHLALLPVEVEIVDAAYLFPVHVINIFAADVLLGACE
jgi:hypothetical protein